MPRRHPLLPCDIEGAHILERASRAIRIVMSTRKRCGRWCCVDSRAHTHPSHVFRMFAGNLVASIVGSALELTVREAAYQRFRLVSKSWQ